MRNIKNFIIEFFLIYIIFQIIINIKDIHEIIFFSYKIFIENIIPNLFPFLIISTFLINYGFVDVCFKLFNPLMRKIFKIDGISSFVFIMSLLTGFPSNSKYTKELLINNKISPSSATKILLFTHFSNPLFVIGTITTLLNFKMALLVLFAHYLGNIIVGIIFRRKYIDNSSELILKNDEKPFGIVLLSSIKSAIDTLLLIYGTMTFFLIVSDIVNNIFSFSPLVKCIISGIFEFTQGLKYTSMLSLSLRYKAILMGMFISFGGISVHAQILSIISDTLIKYKPFLIARLIHAFITGLILYLII